MKRKSIAAPRLIALLSILLISACANTPTEQAPPIEAELLLPALAYYQSLQRMPLAEMSRERTIYAAQPAMPGSQLRLAMLFGHPRGSRELGRAQVLLDTLLKSGDPDALPLQPLARVLADNYGERLKLDAQLDKQGVQLSESQRKAADLQEKLDGLADIERSLPVRARSLRPAIPAGLR